VKHRTLFAQRIRKLRKAAKLSLENAAERGNITGNFWGDVERGNKVPSLDTIVAMAKGLAVPPSVLLLLEREEDPRDIRKRIDSLLTKCNPQQLEMVHRIILGQTISLLAYAISAVGPASPVDGSRRDTASSGR
jgi:transcriptional regulator with XRE-family HTH domain